MAVSRQKVSAAFRKAGIPAAKWNPSGQVRGWGDWSSGVRVRQEGSRIVAYWQPSRHTYSSAWEVTQTERLADALSAAGIPWELADGRLVIVEAP